MKILFVTYDFPFPITSGGKNRAFSLIKNTANDAEIYLYSFVRDDFHSDFTEELKKIGVRQIYVKKRRKIKDIVNLSRTLIQNTSIFKTLYFENEVLEELKKIILDEKIDIVHFESSYTGFYINSDLSRMHVKKVLGTENIEFMLYEDYAKSKSFFLKPVLYHQVNRFRKEELEMVKKSDMVTTVTQNESDILNELTGKKSEIIANGIDPKEYSYGYDGKLKNNILFVGNFAYFPNVDAVNFFYENIFKKLDKSINVTIVGKNAHEKFKFDNERIILKEYVEDIISEYRNADMLIFPVRIGGGTNFKILEAMSLGLPIVAFPDRLSGLKAVQDEHFLGARSGEEFALQIERLYKDKKKHESLAKNARKLIVENFAWEKIGKDLVRVWRKIL